MLHHRLRSLRHQLPRQDGQSMIEFALLLPVLLTMLLGAFDVGRMYFSLIAIQNAAAEGALYAAIEPNCVDASECADPNNVEFRARSESPHGLIDLDRISIEVLPLDRSNLREGDSITVLVHYDYDILTPLISPLVEDGKLRLTARAVQNIIDLKE